MESLVAEVVLEKKEEEVGASTMAKGALMT
jgi:hypothetical protein